MTNSSAGMSDGNADSDPNDLLVRLAADLAAARTLHEVANVISNHAGAAMGAVMSVVALWSVDEDFIEVVMPESVSGELRSRWSKIPLDASTILVECIKTDAAVFASTAEELSERYPTGFKDSQRFGIKSCAAFPIQTGDPEFRAAVSVSWDRPDARAHHPSLAAILGLCGAVVDRARTSDNARLSAERHKLIAQRLQAGLLPAKLPEIPGYDVAFRYEAAADTMSVGGDWYDVLQLESEDFSVVIGDVVGHDIDSAIAMSQLRNALAGACHVRPSPPKVLSALDEFARYSDVVTIATTFYGRLKPESGHLTYTSGGHPAPLIVRREGVIEFLDKATGPPIGVPGERPSATAELNHGDILFCYTDGLLEHRSEHIDIGIKRLEKSLSAAGVEMALDALIDTVCDEVPHPEREDDIALLAIRRRTAG